MSFIVCRTSRVLNSILPKSKWIWNEGHQGHFLPSLATGFQIKIQNRSSSYSSSDYVHDINEYPEVEIVKNPPEWKYVERLLPPMIVPKPKPKSEYASGWKPPKEDIQELYCVRRTRNHMIPVYLHQTHRGARHITVIRRIQGDIWKLEKDLRGIVEKARNGRLCASQVNEMSCQIRFHGDYVNLIKDYLLNKGF